MNILNTNGHLKEFTISRDMQKHFNVPINHAQTILNQINSGMYSRWFENKKDLTVFDFGANVGLVSLYMLPACKKLVCVEPTPNHFNLLVELLNDYRSPEQIVIFSPNALTEENKQYTFATGHSTENKVTSPDGYGNNKITVYGQTLSTFIGETEVDFCKIDIEGGEMKALTINELKLVYGKVKTFFVEVHPAFGGCMDENRNELLSRFEQAGYKTETLDFQTIIATL